MFTVELKINGALIAHIHGVNKGLAEEGKGENLYHYEYYDVEEREIYKGKILHNRDDGLRWLIKKILEDV